MHDKIKKQLQQYYMQNFTHTHHIFTKKIISFKSRIWLKF